MQLATLIKWRKAPAMLYFERERVMIFNSLELQLEKLSYIILQPCVNCSAYPNVTELIFYDGFP